MSDVLAAGLDTVNRIVLGYNAFVKTAMIMAATDTPATSVRL